MTKKNESWSPRNFPDRLFVLGAGPSLELLWPHREKMSSWGDWVIQRGDLTLPFLKYINPLYSICYFESSHPKVGKINRGLAKIELNNTMGDIRGGCSIGAFMSQFYKFGGKELFLFGYDGSGDGYWRGQSPEELYKKYKVDEEKTRERHQLDRDEFNKINWAEYDRDWEK